MMYYLSSKKKSTVSIYKYLKAQKLPIIKMKQTHSKNIAIISSTPSKPLTTIQNTDGLITNLNNCVLAVKFADCMPIMISHPKPYLAILHAGRKGTDLNLLKIALNKLKQLCESNKQFTIWFGPHICTQCFEINREQKKHYSLINYNIHQLKSELNLSDTNLAINTICTACNNKFYSYRGDNHTRKRNFLFCHL